jgi:hypothetical protein
VVIMARGTGTLRLTARASRVGDVDVEVELS